MSKKTGRVDAKQPLATVEDSDGFRHTSSTATAEQMMSGLNLAAEAPPAEGEKPPDQVAAPVVAEADPLDALTDDEIAERADLDRLNPRHLPRKSATAQLVKRATKRRTELEAEKLRATQLETELAEAKKAKPAAEPPPKVEAPKEPEPFVRKAFETPRPKYQEPADPYDVEAVRDAQQKHDEATDAWYTARDTHNDEQRRLEQAHAAKTTDADAKAEAERLAAVHRATAVIYDRAKGRHADYDDTMKKFIDAGGSWSVGINNAILHLGAADIDLAADVTRALVDPANREHIARLAALAPEAVPYALNSFIADPARLKRPAAVTRPAGQPVVEKQSGPAGGAPVTHAREPFNPGGASPESPVHGRDVPITAIPTNDFDVFMKRRDDEDGRGRRARG